MYMQPYYITLWEWPALAAIFKRHPLPLSTILLPHQFPDCILSVQPIHESNNPEYLALTTFQQVHLELKFTENHGGSKLMLKSFQLCL